MNGNEHIKYKPGSYTTIGQDGNHYNQAINQGNNTSVPSNVLNALYQNSDHLPLSIVLEYGENIGIEDYFASFPVRLQNPCRDNLRLFFSAPLQSKTHYRLIDMMGKTHLQGILNSADNDISIPLYNVGKGIYILILRTAKGDTLRLKVVKS